jgi:hypothetical protein
MALQLRRGTNSNRTTITPEQGELVYVTDYSSQNVSPLYIGDGLTAGGNPAGVSSINGLFGAVSITTNSIPEGGGLGNNEYFTVHRAADAAGAMIQGGVLSNILISYNSTTHTITISNPSIIQSGTANSLAYWASNGTTLSPSSSMTWNETANLLQNVNGTIQVVANNSNRNVIIADTFYTGTTGNAITIRRARGTNITPTASANGDSIGGFDWYGYDGTQYGLAASISADVVATPANNSGIIAGELFFTVTNTSGQQLSLMRLVNTGILSIGPTTGTDPGTGSVKVTQTVSGGTSGYVFSGTNYYTDANAATIRLTKNRGTYQTPTVVVQNDGLANINAYGYDGAATQLAGQIAVIVDGTVSSGKVPGAITFSTATSNGVLTQALKIDHTQNATFAGTVTAGTRISAVTPGNYTVDASSVSNQVTLSIGGTVAFANFSGSILVNCYNSGTVTQYLCGGGTTPVAVGSSKGSATGTMASTSGISGYTFTATEAGVHSFYVIRTRTGA